VKFLSKIFIFSTLAIVSFSRCSSSSESTPITPDQHQAGATVDLYYLTPDSLPVGTWLPGPPEPDSAEQQADIDAVLKFQSTRTKADCARAKSEVDVTLKHFFGPVYGPLTTKEVSELKKLFDKVGNDAGYFVGMEKSVWKRPRPFLADKEVHPCVFREPTYSYPSGHSTISHTFAQILDLVFPDRKVQIDARADQIAEDRVMGGVHFLTDIAAGKQMSVRIFEALEQNSEFQQDLKDVQSHFAH
jgi:acid phosphatase (class A)